MIWSRWKRVVLFYFVFSDFYWCREFGQPQDTGRFVLWPDFYIHASVMSNYFVNELVIHLFERMVSMQIYSISITKFLLTKIKLTEIKSVNDYCDQWTVCLINCFKTTIHNVHRQNFNDDFYPITSPLKNNFFLTKIWNDIHTQNSLFLYKFCRQHKSLNCPREKAYFPS